MKTEKKLLRLVEKLKSKEKTLARCVEYKEKYTQSEKRLRGEISELKGEIRAVRFEDFSEFLEQSGVDLEVIREAVKSGLFEDSKKEKIPEQDNELVISDKINEEEQNEISDS